MATFGSGSIHVVHRLDGLTNSGSSSSGACMIMAIRNNNMQQYEGFSLSCCDKRLWRLSMGGVSCGKDCRGTRVAMSSFTRCGCGHLSIRISRASRLHWIPRECGSAS